METYIYSTLLHFIDNNYRKVKFFKFYQNLSFFIHLEKYENNVLTQFSI